jgi:plastocyanin
VDERAAAGPVSKLLPTRFQNTHELSPNVVTIKAGGSVNFIVSGLHNIIVYDDGTEPEDVDTTLVVNTTGTPNDVPIINDATNRIYRGLDPSLQAADRVEVVEFKEPGIYLVICGVRPHFAAGMYGYVRVLPN